MSVLATWVAHTGPHDLTTGDGVAHALTSPDHLITAALVIVGGYVAYGIYRRITSRRARRRQG
jgi:hypothetical protein